MVEIRCGVDIVAVIVGGHMAPGLGERIKHEGFIAPRSNHLSQVRVVYQPLGIQAKLVVLRRRSGVLQKLPGGGRNIV